MSIQTEINRIKSAKENIITQIKAKGVDVPSDASIEDLSALVQAIEVNEDVTSELNTYETYLSTQETTIDSIVSALEGKTAGGNTDIEDSIVTRTITSYTNNRITTIGASALRNSSITSLNCPNVKTLEVNALDTCTSLTDIQLASVTTLKNYAMQKCTAVVRLDFQQKISCAGAVWYGCSLLATLILRGSTMSTLGNKNCLTGTPIASGTGYIYVPDTLVDTYKANSTWANYADQIKPISELEG